MDVSDVAEYLPTLVVTQDAGTHPEMVPAKRQLSFTVGIGLTV
nr:hypothetical protein [Polynucleobacter paneuropaeus]